MLFAQKRHLPIDRIHERGEDEPSEGQEGAGYDLSGIIIVGGLTMHNEVAIVSVQDIV